MKRTRKWAYVAQEAIRLAALGLSQSEIGRRLEVNQSTVSNWQKQGKLAIKRVKVKDVSGITAELEQYEPLSPEQWAANVRRNFALDPTDDQLVTLGEIALQTVQDPKSKRSEQLSAMGRFQSIAKQLALVNSAGRAVETEPEKPKRPALQVVPKKQDPRRQIA